MQAQHVSGMYGAHFGVEIRTHFEQHHNVVWVPSCLCYANLVQQHVKSTVSHLQTQLVCFCIDRICVHVPVVCTYLGTYMHILYRLLVQE